MSGTITGMEQDPSVGSVATKPQKMTVLESTLRERLQVVPENREKLKQAVELWKSLFVTSRALFPVAPEYEKYLTSDFCSAVESRLNEIIYDPLGLGNTLPAGSFVPSPREALLLVTAAWLHPLGLMWGHFPKEQNSPTAQGEDWSPKPLSEDSLRQLSKNYGQRTARFFRERWVTYNPAWRSADDDYKVGPITEDLALLACLCEAQRPDFDIQKLPDLLDSFETELPGLAKRFGKIGEVGSDPDLNTEDPQRMRLWKLVVLLRLANVCRIQSGCCPLDLAERLKPADAAGRVDSYEGVCDLVTGVEINHGDNSIVLHAIAPQPIDLAETKTPDCIQAPLTLDVRAALEYLRSRLAGIVDEVSRYLWKCSNSKINRVRLKLAEHPETDNPAAMFRFVDRVWALQMAATTCATEGACYFALMLQRILAKELTGCRDNSRVIPSLKKRVTNKLLVARAVQPFNLLTIRLKDRIETLIADWPETDPVDAIRVREFEATLRAFLTERLTACRACAVFGTELQVFNVIIVYGFSRNVFEAIAASGFRGLVWFVPISPLMRRPEAAFVEDQEARSPEAGEDARLLNWFEARGLLPEGVSVQELPNRVVAAVAQKRQVAYLVGTRAVLRAVDGRFDSCLSSVGNSANAELVKSNGGEVIVIAELGKDASLDEQATLLTACSLLDPSQPPHERIEQLVSGRRVTRFCVPDGRLR